MNLETSNWIDKRPIAAYLNDIKDTSDILSRDEELRLIEKIKVGDESAKHKLINSNLRFVIRVAAKYQHKGLELQDLISEGNYGLVKAAERYDLYQTETKFISYAIWWIKQSIIQALNELSREIRIPTNKVTMMLNNNKKSYKPEEFIDNEPDLNLPTVESLDAISNDDSGTGIYDVTPDLGIPTPDMVMEVENDDFKKALNNVFNSLTNIEKTVINDYFGLNGDEKTLQMIADELGLTKERVRQIKERALKKCRDSAQLLFDVR